VKTIYFLGIDGGGTKCKARLENAEGKVLGEAISGPANPFLGLELTFTSILEATHFAIKQAGLNNDILCHTHVVLGLAGVNLPSYKKLVEDWHHPFASMLVTTDLHIACVGAHNGEKGAVIISGTGFNAGSTAKSEYMEIGGHGFILGDSGSGARLGVLAIRSTLEYLDGIRDKSDMFDSIIERLNCKDATEIVEKTILETPGFFGQFAPMVFDYANKGDEVAIELVRQVAMFISKMAKRLLQDGPARLAMIGGISQPILTWLDAEIRDQLQPPLLPPEAGATILARQQLLNNHTICSE